MKKIHSHIYTTLLLSCFVFTSQVDNAYASRLDDIYSPMIKKGDVIGVLDYYQYELEEVGQHGGSTFGPFFASPGYQSIAAGIRFMPIKNLDFDFKFGTDLSTRYDRLTFNAAGTSVSSLLEYDLDFMNHVNSTLRYRLNESNEVFIKSYTNNQRANWYTAAGGGNPNFFTDINSHYEHITLGWRHLKVDTNKEGQTALSRLTYDLLDDGQFGFEALVEYNAATMERENEFTGTTPSTFREYANRLGPHFIPRISLRYGLNDNLDIEGGFSYASRIRYGYNFNQFNFNNTSNFIDANYKINQKIEIPFKAKYRPNKNFEIKLTTDTTYANQTLEYNEKETDDSVTQYDGKELDYLNVNPALELTYFIDRGKDVIEDELSFYGKPLLAQGQSLLKFKFEKDFSMLDKNENNGPQNFIEYDTLFLYPVDNFVAGTEYGLALIGSTSSLSTNVKPQNYHVLELSAEYGITDRINALLGVGYNSGSGLHQFSFSDLASRYIKIEPFVYYDIGVNMQVTQNSRLSVNAHIVPFYKSFSAVSASPSPFEIKTEYFNVGVSFQMLF